MRFRTLASGMFILLCATEVSAQTCLGMPSFSDGQFQVSLGAAFSEGAQGFGGGGALGTDDLFVGASLTRTDVDGADSSATSFAVNFGASFGVNEREGIQACPVASVILTGGPDVAGVDVSGVGLRAGGRLGIIAYESGDLQLVPTFGVDIAYDRINGDVGPVETTLARETYVIVRVGAGFIFNKHVGIVPVLSVPLGLDGADAEFSFLVAYNFGNR